jgi:hypothetical protein
MQNYWGQQAEVPSRMLQDLLYPFGLGPFPLRTSGVPLDLAFTNALLSLGNGAQNWDDMTPLLVQRKYDTDGEENNIIDVKMTKWAGVSDADLDKPFVTPWMFISRGQISKDISRIRVSLTLLFTCLCDFFQPFCASLESRHSKT